MHTTLAISLAAVLALSSCGGVVFVEPAPAYPQPHLAARQSAALRPEDSPELRLPFVKRVSLPDVVYAGEAFTLRFEISADDAPELLTARAIPPLWLQAEQLPEEGYAARIQLSPWLLAEPAPLEPGAVDEPLSIVDLSLRLQYPGSYLLVTQSADKPALGGRPARYTTDGVEFIRSEVSIKSTQRMLTVLPARRIAQPRFYNEPYGAYRSSEATWDYANWPGWQQQQGHRHWDW